MTIETFLDRIIELEPDFKSNEKSLEKFWRSLYPLAIEAQDERPSLDLFLNLVKEALTSAPMEFNQDWLGITNPPDSNIFDKEVLNENLKAKSAINDFDFFKCVLEFQIGELHSMKGKQLNNEFRNYGVTSDSGNSWYNFDPRSILECGSAGMISNGFDKDLESWIFLGEILEMGRIYE